MHVVIKFWEPNGSSRQEEVFDEPRQFQCLMDVVTVICRSGITHKFPMSTIVELDVRGGSHVNGQLAQ